MHWSTLSKTIRFLCLDSAPAVALSVHAPFCTVIEPEMIEHDICWIEYADKNLFCDEKFYRAH